MRSASSPPARSATSSVAPHLRFGIGGLYALDFVPRALRGAYGGNPEGAMAFIRLKVG